jgi:hypothetical protein
LEQAFQCEVSTPESSSHWLLEAPIVLENKLPVPIVCGLVQTPDAPVTHKYLLAPGQTDYVYDVNLADNLYLRASFEQSCQEGGAWSRGACIYSRKGTVGIDEESSIDWRDSQTGELSIFVIGLQTLRTNTSQGSYRCKLFSPYIIYNETDLPMHFISEACAMASTLKAKTPEGKHYELFSPPSGGEEVRLCHGQNRSQVGCV